MTERSNGPDVCNVMWTLWPWPFRYDLESMLWHNLGSYRTNVWNIQIQHVAKKLRMGIRFWLSVHCDLDLGDMTLSQKSYVWHTLESCIWTTSVSYHPNPRFQWKVIARTWKICYDNPGNVPNKGRNFNTQKFVKMYLFVICMISRHWFQTKLLLYIA